MKQILLSSLVILGASVIGGLTLGKILGFWPVFGVVLILFLLPIAFRKPPAPEVPEEVVNEIIDQVGAELEHEFAELSLTDFTCPCQAHTFREHIYVNGENKFVCPACKNQIRVNLVKDVTLITEPINNSVTYELFKKLGGEHKFIPEPSYNDNED